MVEPPLQGRDGGSNPTPSLQGTLLSDTSAAKAIVRANHYTHSVPSGKSYYVTYGDAVVVWSIPANKNIANFILGSGAWNVWELSRLWAPDGHERDLLTRAISAGVLILRRQEPSVDAVVSYADPSQGHQGGVYRAASWVPHGQSEEVRAYRKGPDSPIVARRAFHSGSRSMTKAEIEAQGYTQLKLPGKHRFVRILSKKARRAIDGRAFAWDKGGPKRRPT